jgi:plastocyanin
MSRRMLSVLAATAALAFAACGGSAASTAPSEAPAGSEQPASEAPAGSDAAGGGAVCDVSTDTPTQTVAIANFAFPAGITAGAGDVIGFQNDDSAAHTVTLDDDACTTGNISSGTVQSLVFNEPGDYPFHCKIHPNMTGTITITG